MQRQWGESSSHSIEEQVGLLAGCDADEEGVEMADLKGEQVYNDDEESGLRHSTPFSRTKKSEPTPEIKNPLHGVPKAQLLSDVETLVGTYGLDADLELFLKGALVAQSPQSIDIIPELDDAERLALEQEQTHRWKQPVILYLTILMNSLGAVIQGWDQTGSNGANLSFPKEFGFAANLAVHKVGAIAWRLQLGSACIPAIPLLIFVYICPESPRWYLKEGKVKDAYRSLIRLRNTRLQAARDLYYIHAQLKLEKEMIEKSAVANRNDFLTRFIELFTVPRIRRATQASGIVMVAQQFCGINVIAFYSSTIFVQAGFNTTNALVISLGVKIAGFITTCFIVFVIDTFGRRALLNFTFPNMTWTHIATGLCFLISKSTDARLGLIAFFIFVFQIFYSGGGGPVPFTYSAECFPLSHREMGMSWAVATNNFWASIVALTLPRLLAAFTPTGTFGFYAGLNTLALILIFLFMPETKQRSLEDLDHVFGVSTRRHASFQLTELFPWWFRKWILRRKGEPEPQLYNFPERIGGSQASDGRQKYSDIEIERADM